MALVVGTKQKGPAFVPGLLIATSRRTGVRHMSSPCRPVCPRRIQNAASVAALLITTEAMVAKCRRECRRRHACGGAWAAWVAWTSKPIVPKLVQIRKARQRLPGLLLWSQQLEQFPAKWNPVTPAIDLQLRAESVCSVFVN